MTAEPPLRLTAGTVGKAHGLDGSFYVVGAVPALLEKGASIWLAGEDEPRTIERVAGTAAKPIVRLSGAGDRNDADALRGREVQVDSALAPPLEEDEYWQHQLIGCAVRSGDGEALGTVGELMGLPSCEALVVDGGPRGELLIPLVRDAIVSIDPEAGLIVVDAGFLALED